MKRKISVIQAQQQGMKKIRVAAYARVSSGKEEMLHSLSAQVSYYNNMIQAKPDWEFVGVYADEAETGTRDTRPEFQRLISDCCQGKIDMVITKTISRFARNTITLLETVRSLKKHGVDVYFQEQNIHSMSSDGELMLTILASYAQEESRSVSENCKWRVRKVFKEGKLSSNVRLYGYDFKNGKLVVNPVEAKVVKMIFVEYLNGLGLNAITKKLNRLRIRAKNGGTWSEMTLAGMLRNEKYKGDLLLQKGYVVDHLTKRYKTNKGVLPRYYVKQSHQAIIDEVTFQKVQAEIARRVELYPVRANTQSEFSQRIRCERCGASYRRKTSGSGNYAKVVWVCTTYKTKGKKHCDSKRISEDILKTKCAEALQLATYDKETFISKITAISIPDDGLIRFKFKNGTEKLLSWENPSRRECWTDEMKQKAREKAKEVKRYG